MQESSAKEVQQRAEGELAGERHPGRIAVSKIVAAARARRVEDLETNNLWAAKVLQLPHCALHQWVGRHSGPERAHSPAGGSQSRGVQSLHLLANVCTQVSFAALYSCRQTL